MARRDQKDEGKMPQWVDALHEEALQSEQWAAISTLVEARMEHILERRGRASGQAFASQPDRIFTRALVITCSHATRSLHGVTQTKHRSTIHHFLATHSTCSALTPYHIRLRNFT